MNIVDKSSAASPRFRWSGVRGFLAGVILSRRLSIVVPVAYMAVILAVASVPDDETLDEHHYL